MELGHSWWPVGPAPALQSACHLAESLSVLLTWHLYYMQALAQYLVNLNIWTHNILTLVARRRALASHSRCNIQHSADHHWAPWLATSAFVIGYSFIIAVLVPFFSTLVGLVVSLCYLTCAYTLPCIFTLRLLGDRISAAERLLCWALIPLSLILSIAGFYSSVLALVSNLGGLPS